VGLDCAVEEAQIWVVLKRLEGKPKEKKNKLALIIHFQGR
jgi:hypothetical protein